MKKVSDFRFLVAHYLTIETFFFFSIHNCLKTKIVRIKKPVNDIDDAQIFQVTTLSTLLMKMKKDINDRNDEPAAASPVLRI